MKSRLNHFWFGDKNYLQLASNNHKEIHTFNNKVLSVYTLIGGGLLLLPLLAVPFSNTKGDIFHIYMLGTGIYLLLFFLFRLPSVKKFVLVGHYMVFSILFLFAIYLSVVHSPHMRATILLAAFCIMPLGFIDRPSRINFFVAFWLAVHTILSFNLKSLYALDDMINCLCFAILGSFIGNTMLQVRLESFEAYRLLTIEKETDVLTGIFNRRKLFETLAVLETPDAEKPSGVLMIDIDYFKNFNDDHGHAAGDHCLSLFGEILLAFAKNFKMQFYRYGGEEFVAMAYGYTEKELVSIAESLRIAVQNIDMGGPKITVSIGVAHCGDQLIPNYENVIDRADQAAYAAKKAGRNMVRTEIC